MIQVDLLAWQPRASVARDSDKPTIAERAAEFHAANPHVLVEMLRLARERLARGASYQSAKHLWEALRVSLSTNDRGYRLNNSYCSIYARMCIDAEPRLAEVFVLRTRTAR